MAENSNFKKSGPYNNENNKQDIKMDRRRDNRPDNRSDNRRPPGRNQNENQWGRKDAVKEKLEIMSGPTTNLVSKEGVSAKKFTGRCRLFVGNLPTNISDDDFRKLFEPFGEVAEVYLNKPKGYGFVKLTWNTINRKHSHKALFTRCIKKENRRKGGILGRNPGRYRSTGVNTC
ncbi:hypothetical protein AVEN_38603-1 [Araneus ventricosus]|uniref:RRM domain-containing protein n=1 Tax=Araneus ventricosus TaxID=182803 RepID=A0A4Y2LGI8_ARAVE|nr:hypothetical protein AVEN_38603-1 [Araneus ventricosus]